MATGTPADESNESVTWSEEALQRLDRVPSFLRGMVQRNTEALARARGALQVTGEHLAELAKRRPGAAQGGGVESSRPADPGLVWTEAAQARLEELPPFFRPELKRIAEEAARAGGHLEVNVALLDHLEEQEAFRRRLEWSADAETTLAAALADRSTVVREFARPALEEAAEHVARASRRERVLPEDVAEAVRTDAAGVEWSTEALERVRNAPEFVRGGIKKAAEAAARREGLARIEPPDLTRFRNRAMLRAVKRMRALGFRELSFDVFELARERVPRLRDNPQAARRFAAIRAHVEGKGGLGVIDGELLEKMRELLREGDRSR